MLQNDLIQAEKFGIYQFEWFEIEGQLRQVKERLYILDQIERFPFELFTGIEDRTFWQIVKNALLESVVVILYKIIFDKNNSYDNFDNFVDRIKTLYLRFDSVIQEKVTERFDDYNQKINHLKPKISLIRNNFVAHNAASSSKEKILKKGRDKYQISKAELNEILDRCHKLLNLLGFGLSTDLDNWDYAPRPDAKGYFTDVELLLGFVARKSIYLREYSTDSRKLQLEAYSELTDEERLTVEIWRERIKGMGICDDEK